MSSGAGGIPLDLDDYPMFPLSGPLLPGASMPMQIFEPRYLEMMTRQFERDDLRYPEFGVVMIERGTETGGYDQRSTIACRSQAVGMQAFGGVLRFVAVGVQRLRVVEWLDDDPYPRARVEPWPDLPGPPVDQARLDTIAELASEVVELASQVGVPVPARSPIAMSGDVSLFQIASTVPIGPFDAYKVLAAPSLDERAVALHSALEDARSVLKFQQTC